MASLEKYNNLTKSKRFIGNNPITLTKETFDKKKEYFVTPKVDGVRRLLLIIENHVFAISSKMEFAEIILTKSSKLFNGTLIDCEYFNKKYFAFDILFSNGVDVRKGFSLETRIEILKKIIKKINSKKLILKEYIKLDCEIFLKTLNDNKGKLKEGELDGYIFTPSGDYTSIILKWKPSNLLSNDFKIKNDGDSMFLLLQNGLIFSPKRYPDIGRVKYKSGALRYKDGDIVEFIFQDGKFVPLRARPDKTKSNHISVILDNFREMINPTNIQKLFC